MKVGEYRKPVISTASCDDIKLCLRQRRVLSGMEVRLFDQMYCRYTQLEVSRYHTNVSMALHRRLLPQFVAVMRYLDPAAAALYD